MRSLIATIVVLFFSLNNSAQSYYNPGWFYSGQLTYEAFGWSMWSVGDVNGDGFQDLLISAIDHSDPIETEEEEGKLYLFYGSADGLSAEPVWSYEPNETLNITGFDVSGGDINGDGYSDVAAGCLQWSNDQIQEGKIILFYGSAAGLNDTPDWIFEGDQENGLMGSSVALSGDINSDGYNDLFVAAKMYDNGQTDEGKTWMFWGSADGPIGPVWSWEPNIANSISGFPVRYGGDVNGDGFDDVIIGANNASTYLIEDGLAVAFYGSADGLSDTPDWTKTGGQAKCAFGHFVDGAGDVNGDGFDDVIVSAILYEDIVEDFAEGWVFAFYGSATGLSDTISWSSQGNNFQAQYGYHIAKAGDVNGDGYSEIVIGAKYWTEDFSGEGATFLYFGSENGLETDFCWKQKGGQANGYLGKTVGGGGGDYNNDGFADFLVSAYRYTYIFPADGIAYCIYGKPRESDFKYPSNIFCQTHENPVAEILGLEGGIFTSSSGLIFADASTGEINLELTPVGTYIISYTVDGEFCSLSSKQTIQVVSPTINGIFAYPSDSIFISASNPSPNFYPGAVAGIFSAEPAGIVFSNTNTGEINMAESVPGTYTITNTVEDPICGPIDFTYTLVIVPTCYKPNAPLVDNITSTSATIYWNKIQYADNYDIYIVKGPDTIPYLNQPDTFYTFIDLLPGYTYRTWVSAHCDYRQSPKSDKTIFTTLTSSVENIIGNELNITIYPSPANNLFSIQSNIPFEEIKISDLQGKTIFNQIFSPPVYTCKVESDSWNDGVYFVHVKSKESTMLLKIMVAKNP